MLLVDQSNQKEWIFSLKKALGTIARTREMMIKLTIFDKEEGDARFFYQGVFPLYFYYFVYEITVA